MAIARDVHFAAKAEHGMFADALTQEWVYESILNAQGIYKTIRRATPQSAAVERLHLIKGLTDDGQAVYTKGKLMCHRGTDVFHVLWCRWSK